jgi:hypothetical protein
MEGNYIKLFNEQYVCLVLCGEDFFVLLWFVVVCVFGSVFGLEVVLGFVWVWFCVVFNVAMRDLYVI